MLDVGGQAISLTANNVWVMWFCPALSSTFFYLKQTEIVVVVVVVETEMQNFDLKFSGGASPDPRTGWRHHPPALPMPSDPQHF